jgi:hypothetical protein
MPHLESLSSSEEVEVKPKKKVSKTAQCVRAVGNFGVVNQHHLIDSPSFNNDLFEIEMPIGSPKLAMLVKTIARLDEQDKRNHNRLFKHMIFTDVESSRNGVKVIGSALQNAGFVHCYSPMGTGFHMKTDQELASTKNQNFAILISKSIWGRPVNPRFKKNIVAKYNERPDNVYGEKLRIILLDTGYKEGIDLFDVKYIHLFDPLVAADEKQAIGRGTRFCGQMGLTFHPVLGWPLHVYKYENNIEQMTDVYNAKTLGELWLHYLDLDIRRVQFAAELEDVIVDAAVDKELTKAVHTFSINYNQIVPVSKGGATPSTASLARTTASDTVNSRQSNIVVYKPAYESPRKMGAREMQRFVRKNYAEFAYPDAKLENLCARPKDAVPQRIMSFTPTQDFVRHYFTPESAYKGMLLYHSVGAGKTCTAIATASSSFQKQGYTILYVTRHTLKQDVWKNIIGQVCHVILKDRIDAGLKLPDKVKPNMSYAGPEWLQPMSYKQFTNLLQRQNHFYEELVSRNGAADPLKRTLVIIDEAHKLYSKMAGAERPDIGTLEKWIDNSYTMSGKDSCRLLLMTGTPYVDDGMELVKLLNLLRSPKNKFPVEFNDFMSKYLSRSTGKFTSSGREAFMDDVSGYVSYLNRSRDGRMFSHPVYHTITATVKEYVKGKPQKEKENKLKELKKQIKNTEVSLRQKLREVKRQAKGVEQQCRDEFYISAKKRYEELKQEYHDKLGKIWSDKKVDLEKCADPDPRKRTDCRAKVTLQSKEKEEQHKSTRPPLWTEYLKAVDMSSCKDKEYNKLADSVRNKHSIEEQALLNEYNELDADVGKDLKELRKVAEDARAAGVRAREIRSAHDYQKSLLQKKTKELRKKLQDDPRELRAQLQELRNDMNKKIKDMYNSYKEKKAKVNELKMRKVLLRIRLDRARIPDISPYSAIYDKCMRNHRIETKQRDSPSQETEKKTVKTTPVTATREIRDLLRRYYEPKLNGEPLTRAELLLKFHPDKLPQNLKELYRTNNGAKRLIDMVFSDIYTAKTEGRDVSYDLVAKYFD